MLHKFDGSDYNTVPFEVGFDDNAVIGYLWSTPSLQRDIECSLPALPPFLKIWYKRTAVSWSLQCNSKKQFKVTARRDGGWVFCWLFTTEYTTFGRLQIRKEDMTCGFYFKNRVCAYLIVPELQTVPLR